MFKVISQQLEGPLTTAFETTPYSYGLILRTWINIGTNYFLSKFLGTTIDESAWKIIYTLIRDLLLYAPFSLK